MRTKPAESGTGMEGGGGTNQDPKESQRMAAWAAEDSGTRAEEREKGRDEGSGQTPTYVEDEDPLQGCSPVFADQLDKVGLAVVDDGTL